MKEVLIVGSGRSGRGMLAEMAYKDGFHVVLADIDSALMDGLKKQAHFSVQMTDLKSQTSTETIVENYETLDIANDYQGYVKKIATSKYVLSALMPEAFPHFSKAIVDAYHYRLEKGINSNLYITLGANYVGLRQKYQKLISDLLKPNEKLADNNIYLVMSIVNRKNLLPEKEDETEDKYRVIGDNKSVLRLDDLQQLKEEKDCPSFFRFEDNIDGSMAIKIWTGNIVQCTMAFVALDKKMSRTYEASFDKDASQIAFYASQEAYNAVKCEYNAPERSLEDIIKSVTIFRNPSFSDSLYRITREPIRKFGREDRFVGPALCCLRHSILPYYISLGLAYGFKYKDEQEPQSLEIAEYIKSNGIREAVCHYCQLNEKEKDEKILIDLVVDHYNRITMNNPTEVKE